jgi:hypothetical protein
MRAGPAAALRMLFAALKVHSAAAHRGRHCAWVNRAEQPKPNSAACFRAGNKNEPLWQRPMKRCTRRRNKSREVTCVWVTAAGVCAANVWLPNNSTAALHAQHTVNLPVPNAKGLQHKIVAATTNTLHRPGPHAGKEHADNSLGSVLMSWGQPRQSATVLHGTKTEPMLRDDRPRHPQHQGWYLCNK